MRSIKATFLKVKEKYPYYSDFINFSIAIEGREFTKDRISRSFNRLVNKNDYFDSKNRLLNHLVYLSNCCLRKSDNLPNFKSKALKIQS